VREELGRAKGTAGRTPAFRLWDGGGVKGWEPRHPRARGIGHMLICLLTLAEYTVTRAVRSSWL
jgi:hypothetical protein